MALTENFSVSQNAGDIEQLTITDTSTGSDSAVTVRRVYLQKQDGTYLVPEGTTTDYIVWPLVDTAIDIEVLNKDYAIDITVQWLQITTVLYTKTELNLFSAYASLFLRNLTRFQSSNPILLSNGNFWANKFKLRTLLDDAIQAVELLNDQTAASYCISEAKRLIDTPNTFF